MPCQTNIYQQSELLLKINSINPTIVTKHQNRNWIFKTNVSSLTTGCDRGMMVQDVPSHSKGHSPHRMTGQAKTKFFFGNEVEPPKHFHQSTVHVAIRATTLAKERKSYLT